MFWKNEKELKIEEDKIKLALLMKDIESIKHTLSLLEAKLETLKETKTISESDKETLAELSIKMAKLWSLLLDKTPNGKEKINKTGKRLYGGKLYQE